MENMFKQFYGKIIGIKELGKDIYHIGTMKAFIGGFVLIRENLSYKTEELPSILSYLIDAENQDIMHGGLWRTKSFALRVEKVEKIEDLL